MNTDMHLVANFLNSRKEGDFLILYRKHTPKLYQTAIRISGRDEDMAQEMIQEMWVIAVQKLAYYKGLSSLRTWLTGILINLSKEWYRKESKFKNFTQVHKNENTEKSDRQKVEAMDLEMAIASLPEGYRQIIVLHDIEGYTHKEIGEMLLISDGTSKSQLFNARRAMREYLREDLKDGTNGN